MTDNEALNAIYDEVLLIRQELVAEGGTNTMLFLGTDANGFYILIILVVFSILFMRK